MGLAPHGWTSSHLCNRVSTPQSLSAPPPPSSWQNGPPRLGEEYRDHMTLPQAPGQLLGCQQKPRPSKALLAFEPLRDGIDKNLLQTSTVLGSPG